MKIALIQQHADPDKKDNIQRAVAAYENAAQKGAQLIAFAELAFTVFYPQNPAGDNNLNLAEPIPGPTTDRFMELAQKYQVVTVLNLFEKNGNHTYDSSPVIDADGSLLGVTRMVHIMEGPCYHEQGYYTPGDGQSLVFDTAVGKRKLKDYQSVKNRLYRIKTNFFKINEIKKKDFFEGLYTRLQNKTR